MLEAVAFARVTCHGPLRSDVSCNNQAPDVCEIADSGPAQSTAAIASWCGVGGTPAKQ